ncbi:MAG TPA: histidine kinase, partial [Actinomycetales bacterium]|nr:histidine kinase [Actinomycetales bacterium]
DRGRDSGGSGLGLAIVAEITRSHGGSVHVADAPGGGARFVVELPVEPLDAPED